MASLTHRASSTRGRGHSRILFWQVPSRPWWIDRLTLYEHSILSFDYDTPSHLFYHSTPYTLHSTLYTLHRTRSGHDGRPIPPFSCRFHLNSSSPYGARPVLDFPMISMAFRPMVALGCAGLRCVAPDAGHATLYGRDDLYKGILFLSHRLFFFSPLPLHPHPTFFF